MLRHTPVKEIMTAPATSILPGTTLREVARCLEEKEFSGLPVVDEEGRVVGIVSEKDLLKYTRWIIGKPVKGLGEWLKDSDAVKVESSRGAEIMELVASTTAETMMTREVITVHQEAPVIKAVKLINRHRVNRVPVVDRQKKLKGIVTRADIINMLEKWADSNLC